MTYRKSRRRSISLLMAAAAVSALATSSSCSGETLSDALAAVYEGNPTLNAERASLRATDEELAQAQAGYRPDVSVNADYGVQTLSTSPAPLVFKSGAIPSPAQEAANKASLQRSDGLTNPTGYNVVLNQPLFRGFRVANAVREADARILAEREKLRSLEQRTFLDTVRAYMDVLRDSAIVNLRIGNLKLLTSEVAANEARFAAGEMTRTDVAQARARQAEAQAALDLAKASLRISLAAYERLVGHVPTRLTDPGPFERKLPATLEEAIAVAQSENPDVVAAAYLERALGHEVDKIEGELLPEVRLQAVHNERFETSPLIDRQMSQSVVARVSIPIYQSGDVESRARQAKQRRQGSLEQIEAAREQAKADAISAWSQLQATRAASLAVRLQVQASHESVLGVREELKAGQRTVLDVLNAEKDEIDARVSAVRARHDLVIASFSLLQAMGRLTASELDVPVALYDTQRHYDEVNGKWTGLKIEGEAPNEPPLRGWLSSVETAPPDSPAAAFAPGAYAQKEQPTVPLR